MTALFLTTQLPAGNNVTFPEYPKNTEIANALWLYVSPVLLIFGCAGNTMSLIVLRASQMKNKRCSLALSVLAVVDVAVLCTGLLRQWVIALSDVDLRTFSVAGCKIHTYLTYYSCQLSSWTILLVAVERLVSVCLPLKVHRLCSKRRMIACGTGIALALGVINSPLLWMLTIMTEEDFDLLENTTLTIKECDFEEEYRDYKQNVFYWLDFVLLCLVPFVVILTSNTVVIVQISCRRPPSGQVSGKQTPMMSSTTAMLVLVSVVFLVTTVPVALYFIGLDIWFSEETVQGTANAYLTFTVTNLIYYVSNTINFVLYCVGGSQFRQAASALFCGRCLKRKKKHQKPVMSVSLGGPSTSTSSGRNSDEIFSDGEGQQVENTVANEREINVPSRHSSRFAGEERRTVDGTVVCACKNDRAGKRSRPEVDLQNPQVANDAISLRRQSFQIDCNSTETRSSMPDYYTQHYMHKTNNNNNNVFIISDNYIQESFGTQTCRHLECTRL